MTVPMAASDNELMKDICKRAKRNAGCTFLDSVILRIVHNTTLDLNRAAAINICKMASIRAMHEYGSVSKASQPKNWLDGINF